MIYNDLIPEIGVTSFAKSLDFYTRLLSFKTEYSRPEKKFAFLSLGRSQLMIEEVSGTFAATDEEIRNGEWRTAALEYPLGRGMSLSIKVESVDHMVKTLAEAGHPLKMSPKEAWYRRDDILVGERQILVMDPDGYLLRFQQPLGEKRG